MGKASKWLVNFLLGRREDKGKKMDITIHGENNVTIPITSLSSTPTHKRRWSFGKSSSKESGVHKSSKSLDLNNTVPIITHTVSSLELKNQSKKAEAVDLAIATPEAIKRVAIPINASVRIRRNLVENGAATRIQAAFRSYLARKALRALKGLVKLQALVRGHQVRKQTTTTLQRLHALLAIQVRARCHRIQMAEESRRVVRSQSSRHQRSNHVNCFDFNHKEPADMKTCHTHGISDERNKSLSQPSKGSSGDLSSIFLIQQHLQRETCFATPKPIPGRASVSSEQLDCVPSADSESLSQPNYVANTKSSRAKARSESEPKQRPEWSIRPTSKQRASIGGMSLPFPISAE